MFTPPVIDQQRLAYGVNEAAAVLGVTPRSIYTYMNDGLIKSFKLGGRRLIRRTDLEQFIEGIVA